MSSTLLPPRGLGPEGERARLVEAMELGRMMSLTGWFGPACLYTFTVTDREREKFLMVQCLHTFTIARKTVVRRT